jgi:hypothetical protein
MKMIVHEGPGVYTKGLLVTKILQADKKILTILFAAEYG